MQDWIADWNRWSRAERVLAVLMAFLLVALPLGFLLASLRPGA
jgi:hypothetical protein